MKDVGLACAGRDERDARCMVEDGVREGDALGGWLGAVVDVRDPSVLLAEELVAGEEGRDVAVGTEAEEDEVENGEAGRVLHGELLDELLLVRVRELFEVTEEVRVDGVDGGLGPSGGELGEELADAEPMVRILVVEGHDALINVENMPRDAGRR